MKTNLHSLNNDQRLYILTCGSGYSCLGFEVCQDRSERLAADLEIPFHQFPIGTDKHYEYYLSLVELARQRWEKTGKRSEIELNPALIGLEGRRIEATVWGERKRFNVGKSTGFIPVHLMIHNSRSISGPAIGCKPDDIEDIRIVR